MPRPLTPIRLRLAQDPRCTNWRAELLGADASVLRRFVTLADLRRFLDALPPDPPPPPHGIR